MIEFIVRENLSEERLDRVLRKILKNAPESFLYSQLRKKNITLNGKRAEGSTRTAAGDRIRFYFSEETFRKMQGEKRVLPVPEDDRSYKTAGIRVVYEDEDVLLLEKPAGIPAEKPDAETYSVNDWVIDHERLKGKLSGSEYEWFRPAVVNRLDVNTTGIMAAGVSQRGLRLLSELFRERTLSKYYYALVVGEIRDAGTRVSYLVKDRKNNKVQLFRKEVPGSKEIRTEYEPVRYDPEKDLTLVRVHLLTGRSHQIRAEFSSMGHPVLGDPKYGDPKANLKFLRTSQCLLSYKMEFPECALSGVSGKTFEIGIPKDWPVLIGGEK